MPKSNYPRDVLNRLKWEKGYSLEDAEITIVHRGAPDDRRTISGREVIKIGHTFFETTETSIPFHRVLEIKYNGETLFEKKTR